MYTCIMFLQIWFTPHPTTYFLRRRPLVLTCDVQDNDTLVKDKMKQRQTIINKLMAIIPYGYEIVNGSMLWFTVSRSR